MVITTSTATAVITMLATEMETITRVARVATAMAGVIMEREFRRKLLRSAVLYSTLMAESLDSTGGVMGEIMKVMKQPRTTLWKTRTPHPKLTLQLPRHIQQGLIQREQQPGPIQPQQYYQQQSGHTEQQQHHQEQPGHTE